MPATNETPTHKIRPVYPGPRFSKTPESLRSVWHVNLGVQLDIKTPHHHNQVLGVTNFGSTNLELSLTFPDRSNEPNRAPGFARSSPRAAGSEQRVGTQQQILRRHVGVKGRAGAPGELKAGNSA